MCFSAVAGFFFTRTKIRSGELPAKRLKGGQTVLVEVRDVLALLEPYTGRE